jgi:hypothetical protein
MTALSRMMLFMPRGTLLRATSANASIEARAIPSATAANPSS